MADSNQAFVQAQDLALKDVYSDVTFRLDRGQVGAVFGTDGCGKTSLLLTLGGRMRVSSGSASVGGFDVKRDYRTVRNMSGITVISRVNDVPENLTVHDILASDLRLAGCKGNKKAVSAYLDEWDFASFESVRYRDLETPDRTLFGIMLAFVGDPSLVLVDDIQKDLTQFRSLVLVEKLKELAESRNIAVLFATHEYDIACNADGLVVMSQKAEEQRQNALAGRGSLLKQCPVLGTGNGVVAK